MCGAGGGAGTHSTCGSYFNAGTKDFPAVPYSSWDFNDGKCKTSSGEIENYNDVYQVRLLCSRLLLFYSLRFPFKYEIGDYSNLSGEFSDLMMKEVPCLLPIP